MLAIIQDSDGVVRPILWEEITRSVYFLHVGIPYFIIQTAFYFLGGVGWLAAGLICMWSWVIKKGKGGRFEGKSSLENHADLKK